MTSELTANILVVDDDVKTLTAMEALLSGPGRNIVTADSGQEALRRLLRQDFALILLDVRLPVMDGFETAALIRQNERFRYTPIIFLSAIDTLESDVFRGVASGAVDYLFKPVVREVLLAKVSVFVDLFRMNEQLKQQAVRQTEERFRLVVESLQDYAVFMTDPDGGVSSWNLGAERILGWNQQDVIGQWFGSFYTLEDQERDLPGRMLLEASGAGRFEDEGWRVRKDGSRFWANMVVTALLDDKGKLLGFSAIIRDLTNRKRAEEELQILNAKLKDRVAEQTAELVRTIDQREQLQDQLLQAQKMESIGTLAGGIAHDFNNILNLIVGYAASIERNADNPAKLAESVEVIKDTVRRGASLVQQLLSMVRKTDIIFEQVEANALLEKLQPLLHETFPKTIDVSLELAEDLPPVMADVNQLNQVMLNLCVNARDAMPNGGKLLLATRKVKGAELRERFQEATEKEYLSITVTDTGLGMNEYTRSRIFEPFFSTKEPGQGTGLGLSVVYGIVRNHTGFVDVTSEPGRGSAFRVYLPVPKNKIAPADSMQKQPFAGAEAARDPAGGETILFVEDEARQLSLMHQFLQSEGYRVLGAKDGAEAVELYSRHKHEIAAVVLDIGLPKLNGWEVFQSMKKETAAVKVLFATGYISPDIEAGIARGELAGLILKPYQLDDVLAKIAQTIRSPARLTGDSKPLDDKPLIG
jgi:two-component system, cell cycle sensor histidine kinase and response regulator CckA